MDAEFLYDREGSTGSCQIYLLRFLDRAQGVFDPCALEVEFL